MYLFFDTETTGLPADYKAPAGAGWPHIVSLSWLLTLPDGRPIKQRHCIIKPDGYEIPEASTKVHGITTAQALEKGLPLDMVMVGFTADAFKASMLIAHNLAFDRKVLETGFLKAGILYNPFAYVKNFCTMEAGTELVRIPSPYGGFKWPKLVELYKHLFGTEFTGQHSSDSDTAACARCFFEIQHLAAKSIPTL